MTTSWSTRTYREKSCVIKRESLSQVSSSFSTSSVEALQSFRVVRAYQSRCDWLTGSISNNGSTRGVVPTLCGRCTSDEYIRRIAMRVATESGSMSIELTWQRRDNVVSIHTQRPRRITQIYFETITIFKCEFVGSKTIDTIANQTGTVKYHWQLPERLR